MNRARNLRQLSIGGMFARQSLARSSLSISDSNSNSNSNNNNSNNNNSSNNDSHNNEDIVSEHESDNDIIDDQFEPPIFSSFDINRAYIKRKSILVKAAIEDEKRDENGKLLELKLSYRSLDICRVDSVENDANLHVTSIKTPNVIEKDNIIDQFGLINDAFEPSAYFQSGAPAKLCIDSYCWALYPSIKSNDEVDWGTKYYRVKLKTVEFDFHNHLLCTVFFLTFILAHILFELFFIVNLSFTFLLWFVFL